MAKNRLELHSILEGILGSRNVYFQPPESFKLAYPCIVYERDDVWVDYADNTTYRTKKKYTVTVITKDPDSTIPDELLKLPNCSFNRHFIVDNLNHDAFILYF